MALTKGHKANITSFKRGHGPGIGYRDRHCMICHKWARRLIVRACEACVKRMKYHTNKAYREKELKRNAEWRKAKARKI
jgi:hypothetical protein